MTTPYWLLLERDSANDPWCIAFGDYERKVVVEEKQCYRDGGAKASNLLIVKTGETQAEGDATVDALNGRGV